MIVALVLVGLVAYNLLLREPAAADGPIEAIPLATSAASAAQPTTAAAAATAAPADAAATAPADAAATAAPADATAPTAAASASAPAGELRFQIVPDQSEVRFKLTEELRGAPTNVVGKSNQVAGELAIVPDDLSKVQVGTIQINARTLETDSTQRNRAIRNFILNTDSYEFITFKPSSISGLEGAAALGQEYSFDIAGDLTIRDVTKPVVFKATVKPESAEKLSGTASTVIKRGDYNLTIPSVPFVANVAEDVTLEIDFVAAPVS